MKRVAIAIENTGNGWLGGVNYFRNLFVAVKSLPNSQIEMILFTGRSTDVSHFEGYVQIVRSSLLEQDSFARLVRKGIQKIFKRDVFIYLLLRKHRVNFLSHSSYLWCDCDIPAMPWIPDFQVFRMPNMYDSQRLNRLNKTYTSYAKYGNCMLLSSYSAKKDLEKYIDVSVDSKVLQFASTLMGGIKWRGYEDIALCYQFDRPWFHLPNQFWAHKNHLVVIEALKLAREQGHDLLVVATGNAQDHRNPDFIEGLKNTVKSYGLESSFLMPGIVPYEDMFSIMRHAIAVINPSKFEGWSTSVEEARSLGKQTILSDIDVHREQSPVRCHFFKPDNAMELSKLLIRLNLEFDIVKEEGVCRNSMQVLNKRRDLFAGKYQEIVLEVISETCK